MTDSTLLTNHKPCPWCGKQPQTREWFKSKLVTENGTVCPEVWFIGCDCFFVKMWSFHGTEAQALAKWNQRSEYRL